MKLSRTLLTLLMTLITSQELHAATVISQFRAELEASFVAPQLPAHASSTATAVAHFVLTQDDTDSSATTLSYEVQFTGLDVAPDNADNLLDDVIAIHLHDTTVCVNAALCGDGMGNQIPDSTAGTRHVLNIFGMPREDDADVQAFGDEERVLGIWDPTDANNLMPAPSLSIADPAILELLIAGKLAMMVHTNLVPSGEIGGYILSVPEPGTLVLASVAAALVAIRRRR